MGGVERSSSTIANYMANSNLEVFFFCIFPHPHFFKLNKKITLLQPNFNYQGLSIVRTVFWLRKSILKCNPDVVLVFNNVYGALTLLALLGLKVPVCTSDRSSPNFKWPWKIRLFSSIVFCLFPPDAMIAQTKVAASLVMKSWRQPKKVEVIPNALRAVNRYSVNRQKTVLAVGRLSDYQKGFDRLLKAFALVKDKEWKLVFAGGTKEDLPISISNLSLNERVKFLGKVSDMDRVYAEAGIFVIPSRSEGFPNALCEAMAAGLPCISFDFVAGPSEIITHEQDGILVADNDIHDLAFQIDRLIQSVDLRIKIGAKASEITHRLNESVIGERVVDFLQSIKTEK